MIKILLSLLISSIAAISYANDAVGTYVGEATSSRADKSFKLVFHLRAIPTSSSDEIMTASFLRTKHCKTAGLAPAIYFDKVTRAPDSNELYMTTIFSNKKDVGNVVFSITAQIIDKDTITGNYYTNAINEHGRIIEGSWAVKRVSPEDLDLKNLPDCKPKDGDIF